MFVNDDKDVYMDLRDDTFTVGRIINGVMTPRVKFKIDKDNIRYAYTTVVDFVQRGKSGIISQFNIIYDNNKPLNDTDKVYIQFNRLSNGRDKTTMTVSVMIIDEITDKCSYCKFEASEGNNYRALKDMEAKLCQLYHQRK